MAKKTMGELLTPDLRNAILDVSDKAIKLDEAASRSLARVHQHVQNREVGIISAHRGEHTAEENNRNHVALGHDIRKAGYGHIPIKGKYTENAGTPHERHVSEHSYLVIGAKDKNSGVKKFLIHHGEKYKQDSVLHKPHDSTKASLHGTKEGAWPGKGEKHDLGEFHPNRASEFHSAMKGKHKTFTFEAYLFYNQKGFFNRQEHLYE